jgi:glycosyltransferase involved in cell wall biosynthesis
MGDKQYCSRHGRHCMVVFAHYPQSETRVQREAEALIDHGYDVDVICLGLRTEAAVDTHYGVTIYRLPMARVRRQGLIGQLIDYLVFFVMALVKLTRLHLQRHYDVVQIHNLPDFLVFVALIPKLSGSRVVLDLHDLMPEFYRGRFGERSKDTWMRLILLQERLSCWFANQVITVSEHWRQTLIRRGVPPEKCSVVMNLADPRIFRPLCAQDVPPENNGRFRLFYHGSLPKRYGLDLVLQAMDRVRRQIPGIHLTIVGEGEHLESLKRMAEDLDLNERHVQFKEIVPAEQLPPLIAAADIGVVPYRDDVFTDSLLPTKLMEYALMGLPCIVACTSAISIYFDETMVQFFTPNDHDDLARCILTLYSDRERRAELARGIQQFNRQHSWTAQRAEYVQLVGKLAQRRAVQED